MTRRLYFKVEHGPADTRDVVLRESPLGVRLADQNFSDDLEFLSADPVRRIEEHYTLPHGKRRDHRTEYNTTTLRFRNHDGAVLETEIRAYNRGVAFRYRVPGSDSVPRTLIAEDTGFSLPASSRLWVQPYDETNVKTPVYEAYYRDAIVAGTPSPTSGGWAFPLLVCTNDQKHWALITEAGTTANFCATHLTNRETNTLYRVELPDPLDGNRTGSATPTSELPWTMPWRVIVVGDSPGVMVEATLVTDLSQPSTLADTSWARPGRVAWSWWSNQRSPKDADAQRQFIDFAAEMGWEYVLVDANWTIMDRGNIHDVIRYAAQKNVGVVLWYNSGGPSNVVTEKPRDNLYYPEVRQAEMKLLKEWGVKGIKVDFFQSDKQDSMTLSLGILKDAAAQQIMVSFHGCSLPRGWSRTYPNLMTVEAVRGEEYYLFDETYPDRAPVQNTILPFTRNVVGPVDYTPFALSDAKFAHKTTYAHELALTVLFETGWLNFPDATEVYRRLPEEPKQFIKSVPVAWDETRFVSGYPGRNVVLARRHDATWYLAGVNGTNQRTEQTLDLKKVLPSGTYDWLVIGDGPDGRHFRSETKRIDLTEPMNVTLLPYGGFVMKLTPQ